jgi:hypothetical protein
MPGVDGGQMGENGAVQLRLKVPSGSFVASAAVIYGPLRTART